MSRKTSIPKQPIFKDRGIQTYRSCDDGFADSMRKTTFKQADDETLVRESEFAKPYDPEYEDYSAMEYEAPYYPPFGFDFPDMGDLPEFYDPWHIIFHCTVDPCYCEGQTQRFFAQCTQEIVDAKISPAHAGLSATYSNNSILIKAEDNAKGIAELDITMRARTPKGGGLWQRRYRIVYGHHSGIFVGRCIESSVYSCCDVSSPVAWDDANSDDTVAQSSTAAIAITGSGSPFTWSVSGTGYTLDYAETDGLENTLNASAGACGTANITVVDCDGNSVIGYVTCTTGVWKKSFSMNSPVPGAWAGVCNATCGVGAYCGQGGIAGIHYLTLKHRAYRDTIGICCLSDGADFAAIGYTFGDGYQANHYQMICEDSSSFDGVYFGCTKIVGGDPRGEIWECA